MFSFYAIYFILVVIGEDLLGIRDLDRGKCLLVSYLVLIWLDTLFIVQACVKNEGSLKLSKVFFDKTNRIWYLIVLLYFLFILVFQFAFTK